MLIAVLSGVRGNAPALKSALEHIESEGIHTILHAGDLVGGWPWPNECIELAREYGIHAVLGEWDRHTVRFHRKRASLKKSLADWEYASAQWAFENTDTPGLEFLNGLPKTKIVSVDKVDTFLCYGSPSSPNKVMNSDTPRNHFQREREFANTPLVALGLSPHPYAKEVDDTLFVNPGSLGMTPDRAVYATMSVEGLVRTAQFHSVDYDWDATRAQALDKGHPTVPEEALCRSSEK